MPISVVIDPAHGGSNAAGRSTPYGGRGPFGLLEKEVTLGLATRVAAQLGSGAQLTRSGDQNHSLRERAAIGRRFGARAFVTLHAGDNPVPEIWVHTRASPRSNELANQLRQNLLRYGARVRRGDLAVLHPEAHDRQAAACVVEVGGLSDAAGERRLRDPRHLDEVSRAVAAGISAFLRYGHGGAAARILSLDLTDFDERQLSLVPDSKPDPVPNNVTQAQMDELKAAWDRMMTGQGLSLSGPNAHDFRVMLMDCMSTSRVLRDAFLFITAGAQTLNLECGRSQPHIFNDAFEFKASAGQNLRFWHSIDLDDVEMMPRVSTTQHHNMRTRSQLLIHALTEAGNGARSNAADDVRYLICHHRAIDEENRYRAEQAQLGTRGYDQPIAAGGDDIEFHYRQNGNDVEVEVWHRADGGATITSIDYHEGALP